MKRKELKNIAKQIAECELTIQNSIDKKAIEQAKSKILDLSKKVNYLDLFILDEMVMEFLVDDE